jgi:hypothetical protein
VTSAKRWLVSVRKRVQQFVLRPVPSPFHRPAILFATPEPVIAPALASLCARHPLTGLALVLAAIVACLLPTLEYAPVQSQSQQAQPDAKAMGRIDVTASLRLKGEGQDEGNLNVEFPTKHGHGVKG